MCKCKSKHVSSGPEYINNKLMYLTKLAVNLIINIFLLMTTNVKQWLMFNSGIT